MSKFKKTGKSWGDDEDDADFETKIDSNGMKERTRFVENAKGQKVKLLMKIKCNEVTLRIPKRVEARKNISRFGDAKEGEENVTLLSKEYIAMEHPDDSLIEDKDTGLASTLREFIQRQQERSIAQESGMSLDSDDIFKRKEGGEAGGGDAAGGVGKYQAPGSKGRPASMPGSSLENAFGDTGKDTTIRVSNLPKQVTDDDVRELFEPFGRVLRLALPKTEKVENGKTIKEPRGFAYVTYLRPEDAEDAYNTLQGYGYGHLILRLEWSKPMVKDPQSSGLSSGFVSGYGTKLAQDTKEKVHGYTDQSAHNSSNSGGWGSSGAWGRR